MAVYAPAEAVQHAIAALAEGRMVVVVDDAEVHFVGTFAGHLTVDGQTPWRW